MLEVIAFNPTMVRLQLTNPFWDVGRRNAFNPTMVRLQPRRPAPPRLRLVAFNPTMVRLQQLVGDDDAA